MSGLSAALLRTFALACWAMAVWLLLTWTVTAEQLVVGAIVSAAVAVFLAPLGPVAGPWRLLDPRVARRTAALAFVAGRRAVAANLRLARRIWAPSRPLRSGMVIVPTTQRSPLGLTVVGLVSSLIVDNQLVDVDRSRGRLLYHAVDVPPRDPDQARERINGPLEAHLRQERG
ncbi:MAG: Na+/H+ antiporter subunit E [Catenulispora sp.]|nr:Na+/H+ antiporter subunit E [Catenulispora sp.]